ncbi:hypothetical protein SE17_33235 [Kouleothrix aurantiaca]|uniref:Uncharacterized protein n=1 Tax=Kouleothrix aurantiaca TaxID=186479 RepID=A0A0P9CTG3_9CHLR|nr:hypothetical protein SE17_33235 [Kouleothrix aurantiaca]
MAWIDLFAALITQNLLSKFVNPEHGNCDRQQQCIQSLGITQMSSLQIETARFLVTKAFFDVHPFQIMAQYPTIGVQIGHHNTEFSRAFCGGACPGDRDITAPIRLTGETHIRKVTPLTRLHSELVDRNLATITERDVCVIGDTNDVIPAEGSAFTSPVAVTKSAICQKGDTTSA